MPSGSRRSARLSTKKSKTPAELTSSKKKKIIEVEEDSCFKNDALMQELENIELEDTVPKLEPQTELFTENDIDSTNIFTIKDKNIHRNAMQEKANKCRDQQKLLCEAIVVVSDIQSNLHINNNVKNNDTKHKKNTTQNIQQSQSNTSQDTPTPILRKGRSKNKINDYNLKADEYFTKSDKCKTSNNTLSKIKIKPVQGDIKTNDISNSHEKYTQILTNELQEQFTEWLHIMEEGFTVLLFGLGSKRLLINNFHKQMLRNELTLIINGFFPNLTLKEILDNIITELLRLETVANLSECYDIIERTMKLHPEDRIYLLIHNIDGGMLRSNKAQDLLSRLANIPNIHVLASADHINAPLIWDNVKRTRYNFYWMNATTFLPYEIETSFESSLLVQNNGALALLSLQNVFASLTRNAKEIYIILVKYQLINGGSNYAGMAFKDLLRATRDKMIVSSDQALRTQLIEFHDHKLVKTKRNADGIEYLVIPLDNACLKQFLEQQEETL